MSRIAGCFARAAAQGRAAFIPFITAGDPTLPRTLQLMHALADAGADLIELGMPFSDPMADGPTIQAASERALKHGFGLEGPLELVRRFRETRPDLPVILFGYYNPIFRFGEEKLASEAQEVGLDGFLVVDLPPEEGGDLRRAAAAADLDVIYLVAPTTPDDRIAEIAAVARGFIYYVSVTGVTGARAALSSTIAPDVARIKKYSALPVAAGFGISTPEQAAEAARAADGVVVGSAIVKMIGELGDTDEMVKRVRAFARSLREAARK